MDDLLQTLRVPLLLLWGIQDPWIRPKAAEKIQVYLILLYNYFDVYKNANLCILYRIYMYIILILLSM